MSFEVSHGFKYLSTFCPTGPASNAPKQEPGTGDASPAGEEEEKKKQKRGLSNMRLIDFFYAYTPLAIFVSRLHYFDL